MDAVVGHGGGLGEALGFVVNGSRSDRIHVAPVALRLRMDLGVAVDLRRGREEEPSTLAVCEVEAVEASEGTDPQRGDRMFLVVTGRSGRCQVEDPVDVAVDLQLPRHVGFQEAEPIGRQR